jgi:hypothetical protein
MTACVDLLAEIGFRGFLHLLQVKAEICEGE